MYKRQLKLFFSPGFPSSIGVPLRTVSYTHLDVYKRQETEGEKKKEKNPYRYESSDLLRPPLTHNWDPRAKLNFRQGNLPTTTHIPMFYGKTSTSICEWLTSLYYLRDPPTSPLLVTQISECGMVRTNDNKVWRLFCPRLSWSCTDTVTLRKCSTLSGK